MEKTALELIISVARDNGWYKATEGSDKRKAYELLTSSRGEVKKVTKPKTKKTTTKKKG